MQPTLEQKMWMYEKMVVSRRYEEAIAAAYMEGKSPVFNMANGPVPGEMHLSNGQEPCAVGVCAHLKDEDTVTATHRPHHQAIAKGVDLKRMTSEIFGKSNGLGGGRGGHMHLFDDDVNFACSGIIGQGLGPAVGAALSQTMQKKSGIAVAYIGEGAANQGAFHESMNLAAVWNLPVVFIIEDNSWGISVSKQKSTAVEKNSVRAAGYGMPGEYVAGNDPLEIFKVAGEAIERARAGKGPTLLELQTSRLAGHFIGDAEGYRPEGEKDALEADDPITKFRSHLIEQGDATEQEIENIEAAAQAQVDEAIAHARASEDPAPEDALTSVFA